MTLLDDKTTMCDGHTDIHTAPYNFSLIDYYVNVPVCVGTELFLIPGGVFDDAVTDDQFLVLDAVSRDLCTGCLRRRAPPHLEARGRPWLGTEGPYRTWL